MWLLVAEHETYKSGAVRPGRESSSYGEVCAETCEVFSVPATRMCASRGDAGSRPGAGPALALLIPAARHREFRDGAYLENRILRGGPTLGSRDPPGDRTNAISMVAVMYGIVR